MALFHRQLEKPPNWRLGIAAIAACAAVHAVAYSMIASRTGSALLSQIRNQGYDVPIGPVFAYVVSALGAVSYPMTWAAVALFLYSLDTVFGGGTERLARIFDLSAVAFASQLPYLVGVLAVASVFEPPPFPAGASPDGLVEYARSYRREIQAASPIVYVTVAELFSRAWLVLLFAAAYKAIANISSRRAVAYAALIYLLFFLVPNILAA